MEIYRDKNNVKVLVNHNDEGMGDYTIVHPSLDDGENDYGFFPFQNGSVENEGVNGVTLESMLAVMIHRIKHLLTLPDYADNVTHHLVIKRLEDAFTLLEDQSRQKEYRGPFYRCQSGTHDKDHYRPEELFLITGHGSGNAQYFCNHCCKVNHTKETSYTLKNSLDKLSNNYKEELS